MRSVEISKGRFTALWVVLDVVKRLGGRTTREEILHVASRSGLRAGGLPIEDGLSLAGEGGFLAERDGTSSLTARGEHALEIGEGAEPNSAVLRLFASALVFAYPPTWVAWWQGAPEDLSEVIVPEHREVLEAAELFPPSAAGDTVSWAWWNALEQVPVLHGASEAQKAVGDAGEQLTLDYERRRLEASGYADLAAKVTWLARESDAYGFDVLSYAGNDFDGFEPDEPIAIEVKSSSRPGEVQFTLYLSAHEWKVANELGSSSVMHIWPAVRLGPPPTSMAEEPIVLPLLDLARHLPAPPSCADGGCRWQTALLTLNLAALQ